MPDLKKFVPFVKVDATRREVSGIVTAEVPDKDSEVCDYTKTKPFYQAVIEEMSKATDGKNLFPLREMHELSAVGKCISFDLRDDAKEIFMTFKVVDDDAWKKVEEGVYTGFSQGGKVVGSMQPDPVFKGCQRYVANPSECSLVDNPCLASAHFTYIKADGAVEIRKFLKTETPNYGAERIEKLEQEVELLKALNKGKTKRVAGKDLSASAFAFVGDKEDINTWKLPISDALITKNSLARFNLTKGIPDCEAIAVRARVVGACKKFDIDVEAEGKKLSAIQGAMRKWARIQINRLVKTKGDAGHSLDFLDTNLGKLRKGMYQVSRLAQLCDALGYMVYDCANEQAYEGDEDSPLPGLLADNVHGVLDTLLAMVQEESQELREDIDARVA